MAYSVVLKKGFYWELDQIVTQKMDVHMQTYT